MTIEKLKKLAAEQNAEVEIDKTHNMTFINVIAPDGKQWADGNCVTMTEGYWLYKDKSGNTQKERDKAISIIIERIGYGLEEYDEELNG